MIVAITGTPATGKTTVAKKVASILGWRLVSLNDLAEARGLYCGHDEKRDCKIVDIGRIKVELAKVEGNLVVESHYAHEIPSDAVFVLRANPRELRERAKAKGWRTEKTEENVEAEIMGICLEEALSEHGGDSVFEVDTTGKKPEAVAEEIVKRIKSLGG